MASVYAWMQPCIPAGSDVELDDALTPEGRAARDFHCPSHEGSDVEASDNTYSDRVLPGGELLGHDVAPVLMIHCVAQILTTSITTRTKLGTSSQTSPHQAHTQPTVLRWRAMLSV